MDIPTRNRINEIADKVVALIYKEVGSNTDICKIAIEAASHQLYIDRMLECEEDFQ